MSTTGVKHRTWAQKRRREVLTALGGQCVQCGIADYRVLQIDHVNGGGSKEHKTMSRTTFKRKCSPTKMITTNSCVQIVIGLRGLIITNILNPSLAH